HRVVLPIGPQEQRAGVLVVIEDRQLKIAEARLIWIRPHELVRRAEGALQHEAILYQPALKILVRERVVIVRHHAQTGGAGESGMIDVGLSASFVNLNAVFILGRLERRRIVAQNLEFGKLLEVVWRGLAQVDREVVADSVQNLEEREKLVRRNA